jgi:hypothetical protein
MQTLLGRFAMLAVLAWWLPGCGGPARPEVATYLATVTLTTPEQAAEDRQYVLKLFAEQAARHGLVPENKPPSDALALYFPAATGLNLSLSAVIMGDQSLNLSVIPVNLGRQDKAGCRAVIAAVDKALQQKFGDRLKK